MKRSQQRSKEAKQNSYLELFDEARVAGVILAQWIVRWTRRAVRSRPRRLVNAPVAEPRLCSVMVNRNWVAFSQPSSSRPGARRLVYLIGYPGSMR